MFARVVASMLALATLGCGEGGVRQAPDDGPSLPRDSGDGPETGDGGSCRLPTGPCTADRQCDDGCFCNGAERCVAGTCAPAEHSPCEDDLPCTDHECLEEADLCFPVPIDERCSDGDACNGRETCDPASGCVEGDPLACNDEDGCTVDSCEPTIGCVFDGRDLDGDGFVARSCGGGDCDDTPGTGAEVYPGATEVCDNGRDDDCDGDVDAADADCG